MCRREELFLECSSREAPIHSRTQQSFEIRMPPTRTFPPVKAVKTERTHEENQERLVAHVSVFFGSELTRTSEHILPLLEEATEVSKPE